MATMSRVVVGVSGSTECLPAVRYAAEVARAHHAALIAVHAWVPPGGDLADRSHPSPVLREAWAEAARLRLLATLEAAIGGLPPDGPAELQVIRGEAGQTLVRVACEEDDLLVIGTGRRSRIGRALHANVSRYVLAHAACPVLAVPPSPLNLEIGRLGFRAWAFRHRTLHSDDIAAPTRG